MKQIKLEVGKTYRSREGSKVTIVGNDDRVEYPCTGNNGQWYTESGRFHYDVPESPHDLIEEVPETRHTFALVTEALTANQYTFAIPDWAKKVTVEQVGNRIIVEMMPEEAKEPKPGDVMVTDKGSVYIFKSVEGNHSHNHYAWLGGSGLLSIGGTCYPGHPATPEEAQPLWDALKKAGKRWNPETMQVEEIPESTRIREWMDMNIKCGGEVVDIAEVIERYLKYREGEK